MTEIAGELLNGLTAEQRAVANLPFPSEDERRKWFYTPTDHGGLTLHSLSPAQHRLVMQLLDSGLSRAGYVTASTIMGLENVLDQLEGWGAMWNFPRGRDPLRYFLRIFGEPGSTQWGWRIGGHHVSVHFTVLNGEVHSGTPCFLGADPASSPLLGGQHLRPLGACEDLARELLLSFDEQQQRVAIVSDTPPTDLVTANRPDLVDGDGPLCLSKVWRNEFTGELLDVVERVQDAEEAKIGWSREHHDALVFTSAPKGLAASTFTSSQREILKSLLHTYVGRVHDSLADAEWEKVQSSFDSLHFAWAGSTQVGRPHYYRVQGPRLLAEYDNTTRDGNHVHTVWRDPVADFGSDVLGRHHRDAH